MGSHETAPHDFADYYGSLAVSGHFGEMAEPPSNKSLITRALSNHGECRFIDYPLCLDPASLHAPRTGLFHYPD